MINALLCLLIGIIEIQMKANEQQWIIKTNS